MNEKFESPWLFVIDTEDYSGNFERELCAYITGRVGECGVGDGCAELFNEETSLPEDFFENVREEADDHGCHRPASIFPTPGWFNHGMGGHFKEGDEENALVDYRKVSAKYERNSCYVKYYQEWMNNPDNRERYTKANWTEEKLKKAYDEAMAKAEEYEKETKINKYPAYLSVAISFDSKPTDEQIAVMKERALKFANLPHKYHRDATRISKITGFRLVQNKVVRKQISHSV